MENFFCGIFEENFEEFFMKLTMNIKNAKTPEDNNAHTTERIIEDKRQTKNNN